MRWARRLTTLAAALVAAFTFPVGQFSSSGALLAKDTAVQSPGPDDPLVIVHGGKYGYIDHQGKVVIRPQFIWGGEFDDGLAPAYVCGRYISVDAYGNIFQLRRAPKGELAPMHFGDKVGFVDEADTQRIAATFDDARSFSDGLAAVQIGSKWGFVDRSGKLVIPATFSNAYFFREGVGNVEIGDDDALIDKTGQVLARGFSQLWNISEGLIPVDQPDEESKAGFLDLQGHIAIALSYHSVSSFSEGLAAVEKGNRWGYIDHKGTVMIPFVFDYAEHFSKGLAPARKAKESGFIDSSGEFVFLLDFAYATGFDFGDVSRFWTADEKFGYVNRAGTVIWGPVDEQPSHGPLLGWSKKDKTRSCEGMPEPTRRKIAGFPPN